MTKAPFVLDHTTKNCPLEGVTIPAGAQAAVRQPSTPASGRGDALLERRLVRHSPSLSNAETLEYEPATQLPQSGLVQHQITPLGSRQPAVWVSHSTGWRLYVHVDGGSSDASAFQVSRWRGGRFAWAS